MLYTWAGPEIAVATTKAYSTQLAVIYLIGLYCAQLLGSIPQDAYDGILSELQAIPDKMEEILENRSDIQYFASIYFNHPSMFFIGRNLDYAVGLEGSLKLKEISYIHSEAYAAGELKHGTISLIEPGTLVVALAGYGALFEKTMSNVVEVKSGGPTCWVSHPKPGGRDGQDRRPCHLRPRHPSPAAPLPGGGTHAAAGLLCGPPAGLRH